MHDDQLIDQLLKDVMAADAPQLSSTFDARVMRRVRPRRLTSIGRLAIALYVLMAAATTMWLMRDLSVGLIVTTLAISVPVATGAGAYGKRLLSVH